MILSSRASDYVNRECLVGVCMCVRASRSHALATDAHVCISSVESHGQKAAAPGLMPGLYYVQNKICRGLNPEGITRPFREFRAYEKEVADDIADFH